MSKSWTKTAALVAMLCMILSTTDVYAGPGSGKKQMGFFAKVGNAIKKASHKAAMAVKKAATKTATAIKNGVKTVAKKVEMGIKTAGAKVTNGIMDTGVWAKQKLFGKKNKVFMGDAGSLILGYTLSFMIIHFWRANPVWNSGMHNIGIIAISTLIIPSMDVVRVFSSRIRDGRNPFLPDKNHIHHKLLRTGMGAKMTMITILCMSALFIFGNYIVAAYCNQTLIVLLDIVLFFIMHGIINLFIYKRERETGETYNRAME